MPADRGRRHTPHGVPQHVLNRGSRRGVIFPKEIDRVDFLELLAEAGEREAVSLIAYALMDNHFHLVLIPEADDAIPSYMQWLMNAQIRQYRRRHGGAGEGHIFQGRYRNVPLPRADDLFRVVRYVEANARAAGLISYFLLQSPTWRGT